MTTNIWQVYLDILYTDSPFLYFVVHYFDCSTHYLFLWVVYPFKTQKAFFHFSFSYIKRLSFSCKTTLSDCSMKFHLILVIIKTNKIIILLLTLFFFNNFLIVHDIIFIIIYVLDYFIVNLNYCFIQLFNKYINIKFPKFMILKYKSNHFYYINSYSLCINYWRINRSILIIKTK